MSLTIREYTTEDETILEELATELVDHMASLDPLKLFRPQAVFDVKAYLAVRLPEVAAEKGKVLLAFWNDMPAGYLIATIHTSTSLYRIPHTNGIIDGLHVREAFRGKGIATKLIAAIEAYFREQHCTHCEVGALFSNEPARAFYRKQGFNEQYVDFMKRL